MKKSMLPADTSIADADTLWSPGYKIPWNDSAFSARILKEHLSQDHHLASRKAAIIKAQAAWIRSRYEGGSPPAILDLGCGPGLYAGSIAESAKHYHGIDFSPASIAYAREQHADNGRCSFELGDVTQVDFGGPYDLAMMLYGELNVFSPDNCRRILSKAHAALNLDGSLLVEFQDPTAVRERGEVAKSWTRADQGGLFSDDPYVCLTENHWFGKETVALESFHVMHEDGLVSTYRSTTKAWSREEMAGLLVEAGFAEVHFHEDWPLQDGSLMLVSADKRE